MTIDQARQFFLREFVPTLGDYLRMHNPIAFETWGGNYCRQVAVLGYCILPMILPDYTWAVYGGTFIDETPTGVLMKYEHAWLYGEHKNGEKNLFIDGSRTSKERLFFETDKNIYPNHPDYECMTEVSRELLDCNKLMMTTEYYTGKQSMKVLEDILEILHCR